MSAQGSEASPLRQETGEVRRHRTAGGDQRFSGNWQCCSHGAARMLCARISVSRFVAKLNVTVMPPEVCSQRSLHIDVGNVDSSEVTVHGRR